jgi:uncharacterized membrane protein YkvA (DUF1232 family)
MQSWITVAAATVGILIAAWGVLFLVARRLPPGLARDLIGFLPDCVTLMWRLRRDPAVPPRARAAVIFAGIWVASPIDLIPEFLPVIGPLDDAIVVALALRYAARRVPREVILEAWPGQPHVLDRLLGTPQQPK